MMSMKSMTFSLVHDKLLFRNQCLILLHSLHTGTIGKRVTSFDKKAASEENMLAQDSSMNVNILKE